MEDEVQQFRQSATLKEFAEYRTDSNRLQILCRVASKVRSAFEAHSVADKSARLPGFTYEFPDGSTDFRLTVGPWRLYVRFVVGKTPVDAEVGRRVFTGRYVFELLPNDARELAGSPVFAVSFDDDGSMRLGDYRRNFSHDLDLVRDASRAWEMLVTAEACIFNSLYAIADRATSD
jgi:hypothetical protein